MDRRDENLLNGLTKEDIVYKYFPLKYLTPLIKRKLLRIDHTSTWEDVYENFFFKNEFVYGNLIGHADQLIGCVYGQSWTLQDESDAMWRIYSSKYKGHCAVRIKTTVGKLFSVVYPEHSYCQTHALTTYIGKVKYLSDDELLNWQQNPISVSEMSQVIRDSFFIKRLPFEHEQEVRIIRNIPGDFCNVGVEYLLFAVDPFSLIDEYVFEPRLSVEQYEVEKSKLVALGVDPQKIRQSDLYQFKPAKIKIEE